MKIYARSTLITLSMAMGIVASGTSASEPSVCELRDLSFAAPEGWELLPAENPTPGTAGCALLRDDADSKLVGMIRARSVRMDLDGYTQGPYDRLLGEMEQELAGLGIKVSDPKWGDQNVPIQGDIGLADAALFGLDGTIDDGHGRHEVLLLVMHGREHFYVMALISPGEDTYPEHWKINKAAFQTVLNSLRLPNPGEQ